MLIQRSRWNCVDTESRHHTWIRRLHCRRFEDWCSTSLCLGEIWHDDTIDILNVAIFK